MKTIQYHEDAIEYNLRLAEEAEDTEKEIDDEEVKRWCRAVSKQHRFHQRRHQNALDKMLEGKSSGVSGTIQHADEITIISSQSTPSDGNENPDEEIHDAEPALTSDPLNPFEVNTTEHKIVEEVKDAHQEQYQALTGGQELPGVETAESGVNA